MTSFPTGIDPTTALPDTSGYGADTLDGNSTPNSSLATIVAAVTSAILALETKVGIDSSADATSIDYKLAHSFDAAGSAAAAQAASQPLDSDLTAIAALSTTSFGRSVLTQANAAALQTLAGLGTAATHAATDFDTAGAAAAAQAASQPLDSDLTAIAALTTTSFGRSFLALADAAAGRTLLGLGTLAVASSVVATGDATGTLPGALTLKNTGPGATGPIGDGTHVPTVTIDAQGRVTGLTSTSITPTADKLGLTPTATKAHSDSPVSAAAGDLVNCDTTAGTITVNLPTAPADGTVVAVKHLVQGGTNAVTYACGGSDVIANGGTSGTLATQFQTVILQYKTSNATWYTAAGLLSLAQLDARYAPTTGIPESSVTNLTTDLAGKAAKTAAGGPYGSSTSVPGITVNSDGSLSFTSNQFVLPKYGGFMSIGHSYSQHGGTPDSTSAGIDIWANWTHRVAGALQIPVEETFLWGRSGAKACVNCVGVVGDVAQGSGVVMRHHFPNHWFSHGQTAHQYSKGWPGLYVLEYGLNDIINDAAAADSYIENAYKHGMRSMISRLRACQVFASDNAVLGYTGTWTAKTDRNVFTANKYHQTATNGDSFTFTIPPYFDGAPSIDIFMEGLANAYTTTTNATTSTSLPVAARDNFPQSGNFDVIVGGVTRTVTAGQGTGAGTFTLNSSATWTNGSPVVRPQAAIVTWSGTSGVSGTTAIAGQGSGGSPCHVVKRFNGLTRANAGQTIVGTVSGLGTNEVLNVDSVSIEDPDTATILCLNQFPYAFGSFWGFATESRVATNNTDLASVVAEFDASVQVVDLATPFSNLYQAQIHTTINSSVTAVVITPTSSSLSVIGVGSILRCSSEEMLVTAIDKTNGGANDGNWALTVTRNYTTAPDGFSSGAGSHSAGAYIYDTRPMCQDRVHPSDEGFVEMAALVITAIAGTSQTSRQIANSGGYVQKRSARLPDLGYIFTVGGTHSSIAGSAAVGQNVLSASRIFVPEEIEGLNLSVVTTVVSGAGGVIRMGIYGDGPGQPGGLIIDGGTVAVDSGTGLKSTANFFMPLKPGVYWVAGVLQGTSSPATVNVVTDVRNSMNQALFTTAAPSSAWNDYNGVRLSSVSGALPDPFGTPTSWQSGTASTAGIMAVILNYTVPIRD